MFSKPVRTCSSSRVTCDLSKAGIRAACITVSLLTAQHDAGYLKARLH